MELEGLMQSVVKMCPESAAMISRLESLLVGLVPIVARRSFGNVYALLGADASSELDTPECIEFILQESGFFTVACFCKETLDEDAVPRAMEVVLALNAALPRGTFVVKGRSWYYRCELYLLGDDQALHLHLDQLIRNASFCYGIFLKKFQEHLQACLAEQELLVDLEEEDATGYQDPLLRSLLDQSQGE